jgi:methylated-DNA-[protein]-cysteine S-methyltransferase
MNELRLYLEQMPSPVGLMRIVTDEAGALRVLDWGAGDDVCLRLPLGSGQIHVEPHASVSAACHALKAYFDGDLSALEALAVKTDGTGFQRQVWAALREIPPGATASYGEIAARIGQKNAARAVGIANNRNPVAIAVPCHRVIGANGSLVGYGGGIERKVWLLRHEGAIL